MLNFGVKNAISCDGAGSIKQELIDLANGKANVILAIDGDRGGEMLFRQLNETLKIDFVAQAPVGQEWELLPQKTVTKCLSQKIEAGKFAAQLPEDEPTEDADAWLDDMEPRKLLQKSMSTSITLQNSRRTMRFSLMLMEQFLTQ